MPPRKTKRKAAARRAAPKSPFGMRTTKARLSKVRDKYVLTVGRRKVAVPTGPFVSARELNRLVGKEIHAASSRKRPGEIVAIGTWPIPKKPRCYWIMCYYPGPDILRRIDPLMRRTAIKSMVTKGVITNELGRELTRGI